MQAAGAGLPVVIRLQVTPSQHYDWHVTDHTQLTFSDVLDALTSVVPDRSIPAFFYRDEDSDVTVCDDREVEAMMAYYQEYMLECLESSGCIPDPLLIWPKASCAVDSKNINGLHVITGSSSSAADSRGVRMEALRSLDSFNHASDIELNEDAVQILENIGQGAFSHVYRGVHKKTRHQLAVKMIDVETSSDDMRKIISELDILYNCSTRYILGYYGSYLRDSSIHICLEYMDRGSVDKYAPVPVDCLSYIIRCAVKGLKYLWSLKILHRDVKPSNILINSSGAAKICDFNVSTKLSQSLARTYIGTTIYMAPERLKGWSYDLTGDVWSVGVSVLFLATGQTPYAHLYAMNPGAAAAANTSSVHLMPLIQTVLEEPSPKLDLDHFPEEVVSFVDRCLVKEPSGRLNSANILFHPFLNTDTRRRTVLKWISAVAPQPSSSGGGPHSSDTSSTSST